ncbi:winged helix-turn-helix domain-containing protein [Chloroflexota bacterium]
MMYVLIIENGQKVIEDLTFCLQVTYPEAIITSVAEGLKGLKIMESKPLDLVIAGTSLQDIGTLDLIRKIRESSDAPLIILSEGESDIDRAKGLELGADDFTNKQFSPMELLARVRALLRRTNGTGFKPERLVSIGGELTINFNTHEVFISGERVSLTPTEYNLLSQLVRNEGKVLTHDTLLERIWGLEYDADPSFVKKYIYRLRSKLEPDSSKPQMLLSERGVGYKFRRIT